MESLQGKLLISSPQLLDPNFVRTVILVVRHGEDGALGLILNRPLEVTVAQACVDALHAACDIEDVLYQGGPCEGPLMVVHEDESQADMKVLEGVFFTTDRLKIESILYGNSAASRFFVGYAGWSSGQLEAEMETGSWVTLPAEPLHVFQAGSTPWQKLLTHATLGRFVDPKRIPDDPSVN